MNLKALKKLVPYDCLCKSVILILESTFEKTYVNLILKPQFFKKHRFYSSFCISVIQALDAVFKNMCVVVGLRPGFKTGVTNMYPDA